MPKSLRIRRRVMLLSFCLLLALRAEGWSKDGARAVISRVGPSYPELARRMHVMGVVRVEVRVLATGDVASAVFVSGHPLLAEEAESCVRKWRFMPAKHESRFTVEVTFDLND